MRFIALGVLTAILTLPSAAHAWGFETHKFIVARAIDILPEPLRPFFEANRAFIVERSIDPDLWRNVGWEQEPPNHFLDMDHEAFGPYPFAALPRDYADAVQKFGRDFIFEVLLESSQLADDVLAADKKAIGSGDVYDDKYFETLFAETRPIWEKRINDAINGVASLITSAWEQAGKPSLPANPPPQPPQRRRTGTAETPANP